MKYYSWIFKYNKIKNYMINFLIKKLKILQNFVNKIKYVKSK